MIRIAGPADLAALSALEDASFVCDGVDRRAMTGFLRSPAAVVLMDEADGRLRGHLILRFNARHLPDLALGLRSRDASVE